MKPMGLTSTPLLSYREISVNKTDIYEDAWGFYPEFNDVIDLLKKVKVTPGKRLTRRLIGRIRQQS